MAKKSSKPASKQTRSIEIELRLAGDPETLRRVFDSPSLAPPEGHEDKLTDLESRYFDTADQKLRAEGLALRVRTDGHGDHHQTLKAGDCAQAAMLKRDEWNMPVSACRPALDLLPKEARAVLPKEALQDGLQKAFETRVRRHTREITIDQADHPASRIEASLDLGQIETDVGTLPIAELELELLEGQPETLYQVALDLQEVGPLHLETRSKSSRAYDQLRKQPPSHHRAVAPKLTASDTVDEAMAAIFASCYDQWLANQAAAIDGRDPEGVHQMRVGLRRLRSAFSVFRSLIPDSQLIWLRGGAKETIGVLGPARDWDVFQIELLDPVIAARPDDPALRAIRTKARAKGRASYRAVRKGLDRADYTQFALRFGQWIEARAWHVDADAKMIERRAWSIENFAGKTLKRRQKKALAAGKDFSTLTTEQRHDLRIALKKLRYAAEFFAPLFNKKTLKPILTSAKNLQNDLGHLNDVAVAEGLLDALPAKSGQHDLSKAKGMILGWHMRHGETVERQIQEDWERFAEQPIF